MIDKAKLKHHVKKILSLDSHPGHIALGFSVGVFISFTLPIPGLHTGLALAVSFMFGLNKIACLTGIWVNSPITVIPSLILSYKLGALLLDQPVAAMYVREVSWPYIKILLIQHAKPLLLGSSIIGAVAAAVAYVVCYWGIVFVRKKGFLAQKRREK